MSLKGLTVAMGVRRYCVLVQGDGAWEPKPKEESAVKKPSSASRGRKRRANAAVSSSNEELSEGEAAGEKERSKPESMPRSESQPSGIKEELGIAQQPAANSEKGVRAKPKQPADAVLGTAESTAEPRQPKRRGRPPGKRAKKAAGSAANAGQQPQTDAGKFLHDSLPVALAAECKLPQPVVQRQQALLNACSQARLLRARPFR